MIEKLERFIKRAEEDELDKEMRPEAVFALTAAVKAVGHNYSSLEECLMGVEVYSEAEALYFEEEDEFPLKYIAALKGVALLSEESEVGGFDLADLPGPPLMEMEMDTVSYRKKKIEREVKEFVKQAEEQELDKEMRDEGVKALHIAAEKLAYKMKAYDDDKKKHVPFPSLAALLVGQEIYEIAEKHYYDPEDEYPLKYISALREVGMIAGGYDEDVDEMESRGQNIDSDDEVFQPPKPKKERGRAGGSAGRKTRIEKEVREYVKQAESQELDKEMREEGVMAVIKAANKMAYKKKWRDEVQAMWVVFPSVKGLLVHTEIYEEAEKYYYDPDDEFPLKYISALKEVAILDGGFDEDIEEMEEDAIDIGSDDEEFSSKKKIRSVKERMSMFEAPKTPRKDVSISPVVGRKRFDNRAFNQRMSMYTTRDTEREQQRKKLLELKIHNKKGVENVEKGKVGMVSDQFNIQMQENEEKFAELIEEIQEKRKRLREQKNKIREDKKWTHKKAEVYKQTRSTNKKRIISGEDGGGDIWSNVRAQKMDIDHTTWKAPMNLPEPTQQEEALISGAMDESVLFHPHRDVGETRKALVHAFEKVEVTKGMELNEGANDNFFYVVQEGSVDISMNGKIVGSAKKGEHFGELNLLYASDPSQPRQKFNLVATESSSLMRLNQAVFREVLQVQTKREEDVKRAYLRKVPFLRNLLFDGEVEKNKQTTTRLVSIMYGKTFKKNEKIVADGAKPEDSLFIIKEGTIQLTSDKNDVFHLAAGSYIGKRALMGTKGKEPNVKDLKGLSDGSLFQIDKEEVNRVLGENFFSRQFDVAQDKKKLEGFQCIKSVNLDPAMMHNIAENIEDETFDKGMQILEEGADTEPCLYLVREGFVVLSTSKGDFKQKVGPGGYFGVEQLLVPKDKSKPNQATEKVLVPAQWSVQVTGDVPCICGVLPLQDVQDVLDGDGDLRSKFDGSGVDLVLQPDGSAAPAETKTKTPARAASMRTPKIKSAADTPVGLKIVKERLRQREIVKKRAPVLDNLEMLSVLGDGEFGEVWLVKAAEYKYALKMQKKEDEDVIESIEREVAVTQELCHPNVVNLVTTYDTPDKVYMLLGLVPGGELWELIYREDDDGNWKSGLPEFNSKFYGLVVADTLAWLHMNKYLFRDLKPENVMIDGDGYPVVVDFGFAKRIEGGLTFTFCGTPNYVAPEIVQNQGHDAGVDHWALGVLIYEMLSGEHPFFYEGMHQMEVFEAICQNKHYALQTKGIDPSAHKLIDGLLEKDRNQRLGMLAGKGDDILGHDWFKEIDLLQLRNRKIAAPWKPEKK
ncbi:unnamed protein product [Cylindrotheca closterium]|uniref:cGMP-dependent protein kinase n=1 Tax=Cylindrotheca closterium TaxID=2856 RepID=A0AAD2JN42_9STRA|nr:unnamed protein product [Cylindrotheca closterium]